MPREPKLNTVDAVVDDIIGELPPDARFGVVDLGEEELHILELILGRYIKSRLENLDDSVNQELMADCIAKSGDDSIDEIEAAGVILLELWDRLRKAHRLMVVK